MTVDFRFSLQVSKTITNGLVGVKDRFEHQDYFQEAQQLLQKIQNVYPIIQSAINTKLATLQVTRSTASAGHWKQILSEIISQIVGQQNNYLPIFRVQEWLTYLSNQRQPVYDIIFTGGGPVGLWSAILIKIQNAALSILVFERRTIYVRNHTLGIDPQAFDAYVRGQNDDLDRLVDNYKVKHNVPIKEVENSLLTIARKIHIQVVYAAVSDPDLLHQHFPGTKIFIGSDGARSTVRGKVFGDDSRLDTTIQRIIQVNYEIQQTRSAINFRLKSGSLIEHSFSTIASMSTTLIDERSHQGSTTIPKNLTFAVSDQVFQNMDGATFANPCSNSARAFLLSIARS